MDNKVTEDLPTCSEVVNEGLLQHKFKISKQKSYALDFQLNTAIKLNSKNISIAKQFIDEYKKYVIKRGNAPIEILHVSGENAINMDLENYVNRELDIRLNEIERLCRIESNKACENTAYILRNLGFKIANASSGMNYDGWSGLYPIHNCNFIMEKEPMEQKTKK